MSTEALNNLLRKVNPMPEVNFSDPDTVADMRLFSERTKNIKQFLELAKEPQPHPEIAIAMSIFLSIETILKGRPLETEFTDQEITAIFENARNQALEMDTPFSNSYSLQGMGGEKSARAIILHVLGTSLVRLQGIKPNVDEIRKRLAERTSL